MSERRDETSQWLLLVIALMFVAMIAIVEYAQFSAIHQLMDRVSRLENERR